MPRDPRLACLALGLILILRTNIVGALHMPLCQTFSSSYHFPGIPYHQGLRRIHSLQTVEISGGLVIPGFRIQNTTTPLKVGDFAMISAECKTFLNSEPRTIRMFTKNRHDSFILCMRKHTGVLDTLTHLQVFPDPVAGHVLKVTSSTYPQPEQEDTNPFMFDRVLMPLTFFVNGYRTEIWNFNDNKYDPNMSKYRHMVMQDTGVQEFQC